MSPSWPAPQPSTRAAEVATQAAGPAPITRTGLFSRRFALPAVLALVFAVHVWGLRCYFPGPWLGPQPFYTNSYALHFARGLSCAATIRRHLRVWSYSPALMAGYPSGTRTEPMGVTFGPWLWLWSWLVAAHPPASQLQLAVPGLATVSIAQAAVAYKIMVIAMLAAAPLMMACAAWWLDFSRPVMMLSAILGALGIFSVPGLVMIRAGMFAFLSASYLCAAYPAFIYRTMEHGRTWRYLTLSVSGGLLTYMHPLTLILLTPPAAGALLMARNWRRFMALGLAFSGVFLLSLGWLGPILLTAGIGVHFSNWWHTANLPGVVNQLWKGRLPFPPLAILALGVYGAFRAHLRRGFGWIYLLTAFTFAVLGYFGSALKALDNLEPGRFEIPFCFYAVPIAALGTQQFWMRTGKLRTVSRRIIRFVAIFLALAFAVIPYRLGAMDLSAHGPIASSLPAQADVLAGWVKSAAPNSRLLVESGWIDSERGEVFLPYFGADLASLWALESGRELLGGSPSEGFSTFSFADFGRGKAFGRNLEQLPPADFRKQMEIYNVGALIVWSKAAQSYVEQVPGINLLANSPPFELYGVPGPHTYLLAGQARDVQASVDCIRVFQAQPGKLLLKYHYFKTLRATPSIHIEPVSAGNGDPVPFIQLQNDTLRDIKIYNAGFLGLGRPAASCG